jgi:hypothetical protein
MVSYILTFLSVSQSNWHGPQKPHLRRSPLKADQCFRAAKLAACSTLVSAYLSTMKMAATCSFKMTADFQQCYTAEDRTLQNHRCENLKILPDMFPSLSCLGFLAPIFCYHAGLKKTTLIPNCIFQSPIFLKVSFNNYI